MSLVAALAISVIYMVIYYQKNCNLNDVHTVLGLTASSFAFFLNLRVLLDLCIMSEDQLGHLGGERATILTGLALMTVYMPLSVAQSFLILLDSAPTCPQV